MRKRIISILLLVTLTASSINLSAFAKEPTGLKEEVQIEIESIEETESETESIEETQDESETNEESQTESETAESLTETEESDTYTETEEETIEVQNVSEIYSNDMSGSGTKEDPYLISNASQLEMIKNDLSASYQLENDLYLGTAEWEPIGTEETPFSGNFSGNNHVIYGVNGFSKETKYRGLFGVTSSESAIECLGIEMDTDVSHVVDANYLVVTVGMLVGKSQGTIKNCYAKGTLLGSGQRNDSGVTSAGILCGRADGTIENCYTEGKATVTGLGWCAMGGEAAGGLCGRGSATITNCYSVCDVYSPGMGYATSYATSAGIIGGDHSTATVSKCYAVCNASTSYRACGIADAQNIDCYYILIHNNNTKTNTSSEDALKLAGTYKGWDFKDTWVMGSDGYPKLQHFQKNKKTDLELLATSPSDKEEMVPVDTAITLYFSKSISNAIKEKIHLYDENNQDLPYDLEYNGKKMVLQPQNSFEYGKQYFVEAETGAINAYNGQNSYDTNHSEIKITFTAYDDSKIFTAGKYITFSEKNGVSIPKDITTEYIEELKYWAAEYGMDDVANSDNLEKVLKTTVSMPAKVQDKEDICLINFDDTTLMNLMRDELFIEKYQKNLDDAFQDLESSKNFGDVVDAFKKCEKYNEEADKFFKSRKNSSSPYFMTVAVPILLQSFLTINKHTGAYEFSKPLLKVMSLEACVGDEIEKTLTSENYKEYQNNTKKVKAIIETAETLYKGKVNGFTAGMLIKFGADMFGYIPKEKKDSWINKGLKYVKEFKSIKSCVEFMFFMGTSAAMVSLIPNLVGKLWDMFDEKTLAWYYLSDYYIYERYPSLYEFCYGEELYPTDNVFNMGINDFPAYIMLYGTPEQIREIQEVEKDPILEQWCQFISKNIRAEKHLRDSNFEYRRKINTFSGINKYIESVDTNELKMAIVKYASAILSGTDTTTIMVACPVTIKIFDKETCELITSVSSDDNDYKDDSPYFTVYTLGENNEIKCVALSSDQYYMEIVPYDTGTMDVSVDFGNGEALCYENVPLSVDESYYIENTNQEFFELMTQDETVIEPIESIPGREIRITSDKNICNVGEAVKYEAVIYPDYAEGSVEWSVDNTEIGSIDPDGTFHALKPGKAVIEAKLNNDSSIIDTKEITVISLDENCIDPSTTITLKRNEKKKLEISGLTDLEIQNLSWYSDTPDIAKITSDGYVLGLNAGETAITAEYNGIVITVNAIVEELTYTVFFDYDYDNIAIKRVNILHGRTMKLPQTPVRTGYKFEGWYTEKDGKGDEFTSDTEVTSDLVVYAYWTPNDYGDVIPEDIPSEGTIPDGIWVAGISNFTYTGNNLKQSFRVYDGKKCLKEKIDYNVTYKNNKNSYSYTDEDYAAFEENLQKTGKRVKIGTFDPQKAPQVILRMKGNYSGNKTIYFRIDCVNITEGDFKTNDIAVTYTGKKQTPIPGLHWNGKALKYGTDFYIPEYDNAKKNNTVFKEPGTYTLTITGKNNFVGEIPITLTISESVKQISMRNVTVKGIKNMPWTGNEITQNNFVVKYRNDELSEENGDYIISWGTNTDVGIGTLTLTGKGTDEDGDGFSYIGSKTISFKIIGKSMDKVTIEGINKEYEYSGTAIEPVAELTFKKGEKEEIPLILNTHYTVSYQKNVEKGTATIIYTGLEKGGFSGIRKKTFKIIPSNISDSQNGENIIEQIYVSFADNQNVKNGVLNAPYMKGGAKPEIIVTDAEKKLELGKDYTVNYYNNKKTALSTDKDAPTIKISGLGNYTGTKKVYFSIVPKPLLNENGITIIAKDKTESTKKNGYKQNFKVYDADGKELTSKEYDSKNVTYTLIQTEDENGSVNIVNEVLDDEDIVKAGSVIRITIQGKGNYADGAANGTYRIIKSGYNIDSATIQINNQPYTGEPVYITKQNQFKEGKVYIKINGKNKELILGEDMEVVPGSYVKNINKGTAKVTFRGINDFGGTKTVYYRIGSRPIENFFKGIYTKITGYWAG